MSRATLTSPLPPAFVDLQARTIRIDGMMLGPFRTQSKTKKTANALGRRLTYRREQR